MQMHLRSFYFFISIRTSAQFMRLYLLLCHRRFLFLLKMKRGTDSFSVRASFFMGNCLQRFRAEEFVVNRGDSPIAIRSVNQNGNFDFAGGNHSNVDIGFKKGLKHFRCHTGMAFHACTHDGDLCHVLIMHNAGCANQFDVRSKRVQRILQVGLSNCEADVL